MNFPSLWLLPLAIALLQGSDRPGIKMTIKAGYAGTSSDRTIYFQGDRQRTEYRNSFGRKQGEQIYGPHLARIVRCDLGQSFELNLDTSEYTATPYPPKPLTKEEIKARGLETRLPTEPATPTIRIETRTTDTGERKEIFGRTARHVITTTTQTPLAGLDSEPQESVNDGWYIDLDLRLSCDPKPTEGGYGYIAASIGSARGNRPMEKPEFVTIGEREKGFAVDLTMTSKTPSSAPDTYTPKHRTRVTQLEEGALDPSLFEIPAGFRHVDRIERNPPPSALTGQR